MKTINILTFLAIAFLAIIAKPTLAQQKAVLTHSFERVPIAPTITTSLSDISGCPSGSYFFVVAVEGSLPFTFQWQRNNVNISNSNNDTLFLNNISTSNIGTYRCIVSNGCSADTSNEALLSFPIVEAGSNQTVCSNATISLSGSVTNASDGAWSGGNGTFSPDASTLDATYEPTTAEINAGSVTLTLTSTNNGTCNAISDNVTITINPIPTVNAGSDQDICQSNFPIQLAGSISPSRTVTWSGGAGSYNPSSNVLNAKYTPTANELNNGSVTLTLTSNGTATCPSVTSEVTFDLQLTPIVNAGQNQSVCASNPTVNLNGEITNANGGIWTGGEGEFSPNNTSLSVTYTPSMNEINNGSVTLKLTSTENGYCNEVFDEITIAINTDPTIATTSVLNTTCFNSCNGSATVVASGGFGTYDYKWSASAGSSILATANNLCVGTHYVTATDDNGCFSELGVEITQPEELVFEVVETTDNNCFGGSAGTVTTSIVGGVDPYTYTWSDGSIVSNAIGLSAGIYSVTVVDHNGCFKKINNITINQATQVKVYVNTLNAMCNQFDGQATATATGGSGSYSFLWSNGSIDNPAIELAAGNYSVIATDDFGCMATKYFSVSNNGGFTVSEVITDAKCANENNGAINLTITGGVAPLDIEWSNGANTEDIANLSAGAYDVIITDQNGCMAMDTYIINEGSSIEYTASSNNPACNGSNGDITITPSGGEAPYDFNWSNGGTANNLTNLNVGNYSFTITDNAGCTLTSLVNLENTDGPVVSIENIVAAPCGGSGSVDISVSGGTSPYTFAWSNLTSDEDLTDVTPGIYNVTVTSQGGCATVETIEVPSIELPVQPICVVTVDTTVGRNLIVWEKVSTVGVDHYNIYRETSIPDQYQPIASIAADALSEYLDLTANPFIRSFRYKISAVDLCGNESELSTLHKTLHLTMNQGMSNSYNLIWDNYEGYNYTTFDIYRHTNNGGWELLESLPNTLHSYTDVPPTQIGLSYMVGIQVESPCVSTGGSKEMGGPYGSSLSNLGDEGIINVGIENTSYNTKELLLYPNPTTGQVTLELDKEVNGTYLMQITTIAGQVVVSKNITFDKRATLNLSDLAKGLYFVEIKTDKVYRSKLVIE